MSKIDNAIIKLYKISEEASKVPVLTGNVEELRETHGKSMDALFREVFKC